MDFWREKWNKAADHSKATDRSKLVKKPERNDEFILNENLNFSTVFILEFVIRIKKVI